MNETSLTKMDVDNVLFILNSDLETLKKIYNYIVESFGIDFLAKSPSVLARTSLEDIILNYLEIFTVDADLVEMRILKLKEELEDNYLVKIGDNMSLMDKIIDES